MASQIRRETVLANFRPSVTERERERRTRKSAAEKREGNCEAHLAAIRKTVCSGCGSAAPNDPHHLKHGPAKDERAFGRRATDRWVIPLCRRCHDLAEEAGTRREEALFRGWGIDAIELAAALAQAPNNPDVMTRIVQGHVGRGRRSR